MVELLILATLITTAVMTHKSGKRMDAKIDVYEEYIKEIENNVYRIYNKG